MTPQEREQFNTMLRQVSELYAWMEKRKEQQISYPLDDSSRNAISEGSATPEGVGTATLIQTLALTGNAQNIDVPSAYVGTEKVRINGTVREIPYIA